MTDAVADQDDCADTSLTAALAASNFIGIWFWDIVKGLVFYDRAAAELMTGDAGLAGKGLRTGKTSPNIHPEDRPWIVTQVLAAVKTGDPFSVEFRVCPPNQDTRRVICRGRVFKNTTGIAVSGQGIYIDVTDTKMNADEIPADQLSSVEDALIEAADHVLSARKLLSRVQSPLLLQLVDMTLMQMGQEIARDLERRDRAAMN